MSNKITMDNPAHYFEEAFPIGNSFMGAMYYGGGDYGKISLNLDSMWSGEKKFKGKKGAYKHYNEIIELVKKDEKDTAAAKLKDFFYGEDSEGYLPLGNLFVQPVEKTDITNYSRRLYLDKGYTQTDYSENGYLVSETAFCSYVDKVLVYRVKFSKKSSRKISFVSSFPSNTVYQNDIISFDGRCPDGCNPIRITGEANTIKYAGAIKVVTDGVCSCVDNEISVSDATQIELRFYGNTSFYSDNVSTEEIAAHLSKLADFDELFNKHLNDFSSLFSKSSICLKGDDATDKTETLFNFGKYLLISSSRGNSMPSNLQGIWSESKEPIWYSAYTTNINLEMNYWGCEKVNLSECMEPLYNFVSRLKDSGEITAKEYFNSTGWCAFHNSDIWNMTTPVGAKHGGDCSNYAWFPGAAGWLCHPVYQHYEYTEDKEYLKNIALPVIEGAVKFYLDIIQDYNGKSIIIPGASPENSYIENGRKHTIALYSAMDNSIVYTLFRNYIAACDALNIENEICAKARETLKSVPLPEVGKSGKILEWDKDYEYSEPTHRHISHLYFNFPENLNRNGKYDYSIKKVFKERGNGGTGWSIAWKINQFARLHDGKTAYALLKRYLKNVSPSAELDYSNGGGTYPNMFCAHPPFQIDGNFGVMSGIAEMLLQDNNNYIELLPAAPKQWKSGKISGFKTVGGYEVEFAFKNAKVTEFEIKHKSKTSCLVMFNGQLQKISTNNVYQVE